MDTCQNTNIDSILAVYTARNPLRPFSWAI
jgi:hypothetical protein